MPIKLSQIPFVRILTPFAAGIVLEHYWPLHSLFFYISPLSFLLLFIWNWWEKRKGATYSLRWISGVLVAIFLSLRGIVLRYSTHLLKINHMLGISHKAEIA